MGPDGMGNASQGMVEPIFEGNWIGDLSVHGLGWVVRTGGMWEDKEVRCYVCGLLSVYYILALCAIDGKIVWMLPWCYGSVKLYHSWNKRERGVHVHGNGPNHENNNNR